MSTNFIKKRYLTDKSATLVFNNLRLIRESAEESQRRTFISSLVLLVTSMTNSESDSAIY